MDLNAMANAMASEFAAMTAPTGQPTLRGASAQSPEGITATPYVVVEGPEGPVSWGASTRSYEATFKGYFFLNQVPARPADLVSLRLWAGALVSVPLRHQQLDTYTDAGTGLTLASTVKWWRVGSMQIAILTYGGQQWNGVEMDLVASIYEPVSPTS